MATEHQVGELLDGVFVWVCEEGGMVDAKQFMPRANMLACSRLLHRGPKANAFRHELEWSWWTWRLELQESCFEGALVMMLTLG